jgi:hypothetical protein
MKYKFKFNGNTIWDDIEDNVYYVSLTENEFFWVDDKNAYIIYETGINEILNRATLMYDRYDGEDIIVARESDIEKFYGLLNKFM